MKHVRLALAGLAIAIFAAALAIAPAIADSDADSDAPGDLVVSLTITATFPRVAGVVTVTDTEGAPAVGASVSIVSTHDLVAALPPATVSLTTGPSGVVEFSFATPSTAHVPGPHTITVSSVLGDASGSTTGTYSFP